MVSKLVTPVIEGISKDAERDLLRIVEEYFSSPEVTNGEMESAFADWHAAGAVALGLAPTIGGAALVTAGFLTTATTWFGLAGGGALLGTMVVPALIGGSVLVTVGAYNVGAIKNRRLRKMAQKAQLRIDHLYLDSENQSKPSALLQIENSIRETSVSLIEKMHRGI